MPLYDFECEKCVFYTEIRQGFDDPSLHTCPICGKKTLKRVIISPPHIFSRGEAKTIGQLADKNTKNMGKYELEDKNLKNNINQDKEKTEKRNLHRRINSMTPEQKIKWIKEGD